MNANHNDGASGQSHSTAKNVPVQGEQSANQNVPRGHHLQHRNSRNADTHNVAESIITTQNVPRRKSAATEKYHQEIAQTPKPIQTLNRIGKDNHRNQGNTANYLSPHLTPPKAVFVDSHPKQNSLLNSPAANSQPRGSSNLNQIHLQGNQQNIILHSPQTLNVGNSNPNYGKKKSIKKQKDDEQKRQQQKIYNVTPSSFVKPINISPGIPYTVSTAPSFPFGQRIPIKVQKKAAATRPKPNKRLVPRYPRQTSVTKPLPSSTTTVSSTTTTTTTQSTTTTKKVKTFKPTTTTKVAQITDKFIQITPKDSLYQVQQKQSASIESPISNEISPGRYTEKPFIHISSPVPLKYRTKEPLRVKKEVIALPINKNLESLPINKKTESMPTNKKAEALSTNKKVKPLPTNKKVDLLPANKKMESLPTNKKVESLHANGKVESLPTKKKETLHAKKKAEQLPIKKKVVIIHKKSQLKGKDQYVSFLPAKLTTTKEKNKPVKKQKTSASNSQQLQNTTETTEASNPTPRQTTREFIASTQFESRRIIPVPTPTKVVMKAKLEKLPSSKQSAHPKKVPETKKSLQQKPPKPKLHLPKPQRKLSRRPRAAPILRIAPSQISVRTLAHASSQSEMAAVSKIKRDSTARPIY